MKRGQQYGRDDERCGFHGCRLSSVRSAISVSLILHLPRQASSFFEERTESRFRIGHWGLRIPDLGFGIRHFRTRSMDETAPGTDQKTRDKTRGGRSPLQECSTIQTQLRISRLRISRLRIADCGLRIIAIFQSQCSISSFHPYAFLGGGFALLPSLFTIPRIKPLTLPSPPGEGISFSRRFFIIYHHFWNLPPPLEEQHPYFPSPGGEGRVRGL